EAFWNLFADADTFGALLHPDQELIGPLREHLDANPPTDLIGEELHERARTVIAQAEYLSQRYHVVVANPPYMGSRNMGRRLAAYAKLNFPWAKSDLFAAFIVRTISLARVGGTVGMMSPMVWMFISTYAELRLHVLEHAPVRALVQLEYSGFQGATVPVCAFVLAPGATNERMGTFIRLTEFRGPAAQGPKTLEAVADPAIEWRFDASSAEFLRIPGAPIAYWMSAALRDTFSLGQPLSELADFVGGLHKTGDNSTFVRATWEVSRSTIGRAPTERWVPYSKGGGRRRWYGLVTDVVDWSNDARDFYRRNPTSNLLAERFWYRSGITYSMITSSVNTFRWLPPGAVFDMGGPTFFPHDGDVELVLLVGNSVYAAELIRLLNPTLNLQTSDVKKLPAPVLAVGQRDEVRSIVTELISISKADWDAQEISLDFLRCPLLSDGESLLARSILMAGERASDQIERSLDLEREANRVVAAALGLGAEYSQVAQSDITLLANPSYRYDDSRAQLPGITSSDMVTELVSYSVGVMFGRYSLDRDGLILADQGDSLETFLERVPEPRFVPDRDNVIPVVDGDWFE
ncbi:Eco57I restriction-modification methylase domain-containing protein, partial [Agromyces arachidis]|uniref:Eco57I restriction-modification methylase domain-containing protein n=1 Tax=Agromyces arachidis TaxID=766966 RepID=UPI0040573C3A